MTGDDDYRAMLRRVLPFYCLMLNHSDRLFTAERDDAYPGHPTFNKEHMLQQGEKGFVPYWSTGPASAWSEGGTINRSASTRVATNWPAKRTPTVGSPDTRSVLRTIWPRIWA